MPASHVQKSPALSSGSLKKEPMFLRLGQRLFSSPAAIFGVSIAVVFLARFLLIQKVLVGGYPSETLIANVLSLLLIGLLLGAIEGRIYSTHLERGAIQNMPLDAFLQKFRVAVLFASFVGVALATILEFGLALNSMTTPWMWAWGIGSGALAILTSLAVLWFAFSWARWFFGEIRWN